MAELLELVGLGAEAAARYPHEFSGGQRQRIGIARAIAAGPKLVIADEPVSALDVSIQSQILNLLVELRDRLALSLLFISHDLAVIRYISERVAVMYLGQLVEVGDAAAIYEEPAHPYTQALLSAIPQPDPERRRKRIVLAGDVPSPEHPPAGCPFHPRCPQAMERCRTEVPLERNLGTAAKPQPGALPPLLGLGRARELVLDHVRKPRSRRTDRLLAGLGAEGQLLRPDERDVGDADEAEQRAKMGLLRVHRLRRSLAVETAPAQDDDGALALQQALRAGLAVAERHAGPQHVVEPGLQGRGDAEIVHGRADDDRVGGLEFGDELVRECLGRGLGGIGRFGAPQRGGGIQGDVRDRAAAEIARDDPQARVLRTAAPTTASCTS